MAAALSILFFAASSPVSAETLSTGQLIEDFSTADYYDYSNSTGLWNIVDKAAEAGRVSTNSSTKIDFGSGADGVVNSTIGYTFDTNAHPNGYNFVSINVSGPITVVGTNSLVIKSLSTVTLSSISVAGGNGANGVANGSSSAPAGGAPVASICSGGVGGTATLSASGNGSSGTNVENDGTDATGGAAASGGTLDAGDGTGSVYLAGAYSTFDTTGFIAGGGAGGGGGYFSSGSVYYTAGGGGAAGGVIHIMAVGNITANVISAAGGNGGNGVTNTHCSGNGPGGNGGAVWLQTLNSVLVNGASVNVAGGAGGATTGACSDTAQAGFSGVMRADSGSGVPASWSPNGYSTANVLGSNTIYTVQSKAYDLGTWNANFLSSPAPTTTVGGGTVGAVQYAGSSDGINFTSFTTNLSSLSNKSIRYLKFKVVLTTGSSAGVTPQLNNVVVNYEDLDPKIAGACGMISRHPPSGKQGIATLMVWLTVWATAFALVKGVKPRRHFT